MNAMRIISMELSVSDTGSCCHGQFCMTFDRGISHKGADTDQTRISRPGGS